MNKRRSLRMASLIRTVLAQYIRTIPPHVAQGVSVTEIKVSPDLLYADVYISAIHGLDAALKHMDTQRRLLRKELAQQMTTYTVPTLRFIADHRGEELSELDALLESL